MQWHKELTNADYVPAPKSKVRTDLVNVSQQARAAQMPLGGMLGERIAKSLSLYESNPKLPTKSAT